jgi:hypothetical protein
MSRTAWFLVLALAASIKPHSARTDVWCEAPAETAVPKDMECSEGRVIKVRRLQVCLHVMPV